jgi:DNA-binding CsgD family transcriptional regulator
LAASAAFLERAAALTPEPSHRARRALAAAQTKHQVGAFEPALRLLDIAEVGPLSELESARVKLLRGQIAFACNRGSDAAPLLLEAAKLLGPLDPALARETYAEALAAATYGGRLAKTDTVLEVAEAARAATRVGASPRHSHPADLLLVGQALLVTKRVQEATPILRRALSALRDDELSHDEALRWLWLGCATAIQLWDADSWRVLSDRYVQLARDAGALTVLPLALNHCAGSRVYRGELSAAEALGQEGREVSAAIGNPDVSISNLFLAGWRGRRVEALRLVEASDRDAASRGEGRSIGAGRYATAVLNNGLGRYQEALAAAAEALEYPRNLATWRWALAELIEGATRSGKPELAVDALGRLSEATRNGGADWALGLEARSRALVSEEEAAESLYREAIERLQRSGVRVELARAHLLYGEWLRRARRRLDAREQLRLAHRLCTEFGMEAFAERARGELEATGARARRRSPETSDDLTPQEAQISRLAAGGATRQEIAARLFISPNTVDYHLRKAFRKLGVKSRHQLKQRPLQAGAEAKPRPL